MTRTEFTSIFTPMVKALQVKMLPAQVEYFFEAYGTSDPRDFAHACRELGMSTPGYLPKTSLFREYVASAREMRVERESQILKQAGEQLMTREPHGIKALDPGDSRYGPLFAKCCYWRMKYGRENLQAAQAFYESQVKDDGFQRYLRSWHTEGDMVAQEWLEAQLRGEATRTPRHLHPSIKVWTWDDYQAVKMKRAEKAIEEQASGKKPRSRHSPNAPFRDV